MINLGLLCGSEYWNLGNIYDAIEMKIRDLSARSGISIILVNYLIISDDIDFPMDRSDVSPMSSLTCAIAWVKL